MWIHSDFSVDNIRKRNGYNEQKISNLISFSNKKVETSNYHIIQNSGLIEELQIKDEIGKLMKEIEFSNVVNNVLSICNSSQKIRFQHIVCFDIIAGRNDVFWFDEESRIKHKKDLNIKENKKQEKTIVIILESPHKDEFASGENKNFFDRIIKSNPALGKSGDNLQKYFTAEQLVNLLGDEYMKNEYRIILMNSIQYQCSLGLDTNIYRDHIWILYWLKFGFQNFLNRLESYNPDVIINLCTKGNHSKEPMLPNGCKTVINDKYLKYCLGDDFLFPDELKNLKTKTLRDIVSIYNELFN